MEQNNLIVFATGEKHNPALDEQAGGSGFRELVKAQQEGFLRARICAVVSNHAGGGVEEKARALGIPFEHFPKSARTPESHAALVRRLCGENAYIALSGCLWLVPMKQSPHDKTPGLDPRRTINIHPGDPKMFGGEGMYGDHVHEAVLKAYQRGDIRDTFVTMHFVTKEYDRGPVIFKYQIPILPHDTVETLRKRVNQNEHWYQWWVTDLVVTGQISWDGENPDSLRVPDGYEYLPKAA